MPLAKIKICFGGVMTLALDCTCLFHGYQIDLLKSTKVLLLDMSTKASTA